MSLLTTLAKNEAVRKLGLEMAQKAGEVIAAKLTALLPLIVAAASKSFGDQVREFMGGDLKLPDAAELAEEVREQVNRLPDVDIPVLSDIFDLTEWLKKKGR